ncbi:hypothetical protein JOF53_004467 [Crossiella equi]|uniref:Secreted protein n=1 Tax=Crossiella equi TaxID=130796 RepID=A0ABS5AGA2_9PSEU|nr:hypothetical protein [Crossiella equi]MBP2475595.1 hypothetical protein [Crossiella equi]
MSEHSRFGRRHFLVGAGLSAAVATGLVTASAAVAEAAPRARTTAHRVEGSGATVALLPGAAATVLLHVVRRFHYEIAALRDGDLTAAPGGLAVHVLPGRYPVGASGGLFPHEVAVVRDVLAECEGVVRWGGDDRGAPAEGLFRVAVAPGDRRLERVAAKIDDWRRTPGRGAGTPVEVFQPERRRAAELLAGQQRAGR